MNSIRGDKRRAVGTTVVDEQTHPEQGVPETPSEPVDPAAPPEQPDPTEYEAKPPRKAPLLAGVLVVIVILVLVGLILYFLNAAATGEDITHPPANVESMVPGVWRASDDGTDLQITFSSTGEYELTGFRGAYETVGNWSVTDEDLVQVLVNWRDYQGIWYMEPISATKLHLEVDDLDWDLTFQKVDE